MTIDSTAFDFARAQRNPAVRERLRLLGFDGDQGDVAMPWFEDETFPEACDRAPTDCRRVLLVAPDESLPSGWSMCWAEGTR
jgi:hypothetical protein